MSAAGADPPRPLSLPRASASRCRAVLVPPPSVRCVRVIFRGQAQEEEQEEQEEQEEKDDKQGNPTKGEGVLIVESFFIESDM